MNKNIGAMIFLCVGIMACQLSGMFSNAPIRYQSRQDLDLKKREMRKELDNLSLSIQEDVSSENLDRVKKSAEIIHVFAVQQDPQMAKRARTLIDLINKKKYFQMDVD